MEETKNVYPVLTIYTDGSCNTQLNIGAWAAIILAGECKIILQGLEKETTNNRMELTAVIEVIKYCIDHFPKAALHIYTDSQYVANLPERKARLILKNFITNKGNSLPNTDLLKELIFYIDKFAVLFYKVKAHQRSIETENLNKEVDMICRRIMREASV